jgi:formylglycine-generating enzyme
VKTPFGPEPRRPALPRWLAAGCALGLLGAALGYGVSRHPEPARCAAGLVPLGPYCCAEGQTQGESGCQGTAATCLQGQARVDSICLPVSRTARVPSGVLQITVADWEAATPLPAAVPVAEFWLDVTEVTHADWARCAAARACDDRPSSPAAANLPVTTVTPVQAEAYCNAQGGALPTGIQWQFAAAGPRGSRYPWGQTGLVCRRAVFGIVDGPCAVGATHPDAVATRPDGVSALGAYDLVGNVAEWTREPDGWAARGGSFRSQLAGALKVWAATKTDQARDDVGFRCAYRTAR